MKRIVLILFFYSSVLLASSTDSLPSIKSNDFQNCEIQLTDYYDKAGFKYYNEELAEMYFEYGFKRVMVQQLIISGINVHIELYEMKDPLMAFGIYSVVHTKCQENDPRFEHNCINKYQVQIAIGNFYISIINEKGTDEGKNICKVVLQKIIDKLAEKQYNLTEYKTPELFNTTLLQYYKNNLKYCIGNLGTDFSLPQWSPAFDSIARYEVYALPFFITTEDYFFIAKIDFYSDLAVSIFYKYFGLEYQKEEKVTEKFNKKFMKVWRTDTYSLIYVESTMPQSRIQPYLEELKIQ
jgi:hypothetical protein